MIEKSQRLDVAKEVLKELSYDRSKWNAGVHLHPKHNIPFLAVDAKERDPRNGQFGTTIVELEDEIFESPQILVETMRARLNMAFREISDLYEAPLVTVNGVEIVWDPFKEGELR